MLWYSASPRWSWRHWELNDSAWISFCLRSLESATTDKALNSAVSSARLTSQGSLPLYLTTASGFATVSSNDPVAWNGLADGAVCGSRSAEGRCRSGAVDDGDFDAVSSSVGRLPEVEVPVSTPCCSAVKPPSSWCCCWRLRLSAIDFRLVTSLERFRVGSGGFSALPVSFAIETVSLYTSVCRT